MKTDPRVFRRVVWHTRLIGIPIILLVIPAVALAYVAEFSISDVTCVYNGEGQFRVLARIDSLAQLSGCKVQLATIVLPPCRDAGTGNVSVFIVARPWESQTVGWTYPWEVAGGDVRGACMASWVVHPDVTLPAHYLDVTEYAQGVADGQQDFGLLLAPSDAPNSGFDTSMRPLLVQLGQSKVRVLYRRKPKP